MPLIAPALLGMLDRAGIQPDVPLALLDAWRMMHGSKLAFEVMNE